MSAALAEVLVATVAGYVVLGLVFALAFVTRGVGVIDPAARDMPVPARLLIVPGVVALWPLMLRKWLTQRSPPES